MLSGTTYDAIGTAATQTFDNRNAGTGKTLAAGGLVMADGNSGANYSVNYVNDTTGVITPASLVVTAQPDTRVYNGNDYVQRCACRARARPTTQSALRPSRPSTTATSGTGKTLTASGLVMADGNGGANYSVSYVDNTLASLRLRRWWSQRSLTPASTTARRLRRGARGHRHDLRRHRHGGHPGL